MDKWKFNFVVNGVSEAVADILLEEFIALVSASGGTMAGGFLPAAEVPDGQETAE